MRFMKSVLRQIVTLGALTALGCSGGGGGAVSPATPTSMKEVTPPSNAGVEGGFVYASQQTVTVDIVVPAAQIVTIYDQRPSNTVYDASGNPLATPTVTVPEQLARGMSALNPTDNQYHYTPAVTVPTTAATVYVVANTPATVAIAAGNVTATFDRGGIKL